MAFDLPLHRCDCQPPNKEGDDVSTTIQLFLYKLLKFGIACFGYFNTVSKLSFECNTLYLTSVGLQVLESDPNVTTLRRELVSVALLRLVHRDVRLVDYRQL